VVAEGRFGSQSWLALRRLSGRVPGRAWPALSERVRRDVIAEVGAPCARCTVCLYLRRGNVPIYCRRPWRAGARRRRTPRHSSSRASARPIGGLANLERLCGHARVCHRPAGHGGAAEESPGQGHSPHRAPACRGARIESRRLAAVASPTYPQAAVEGGVEGWTRRGTARFPLAPRRGLHSVSCTVS
jgi:hypothetical protein